mgnify:CR=1 FL=1|jgi:ElaB/YqjD/DUF883 family membrane-anchored ribosome-binding protein
MADVQRMTDDAESTIKNVADQAADMAGKTGETFKKAADKINETAKEGLKSAQQFADAAQQYVQDSGLADLDLREFVKNEPWIALGVAFAVGYIAARVMRRMA